FTTRIVGLPEDESRALLAELFAAAIRPELVYRHVWRPHDLVFWDNRSVQHLAAGTPDSERRKLYRTTVEGDLPL
ncbi:TauD/TfdA family dioxygenase, partial [Corallococcus coralloides]|nr:TauD/TfdA family dioxygenase [Corallococcus coralloides]